MRIFVGLLLWILSLPVRLLMFIFAGVFGMLFFPEDGPSTISTYVRSGLWTRTVFGSYVEDVIWPIIKWPF